LEAAGTTVGDATLSPPPPEGADAEGFEAGVLALAVALSAVAPAVVALGVAALLASAAPPPPEQPVRPSVAAAHTPVRTARTEPGLRRLFLGFRYMLRPPSCGLEISMSLIGSRQWTISGHRWLRSGQISGGNFPTRATHGPQRRTGMPEGGGQADATAPRSRRASARAAGPPGRRGARHDPPDVT
jgi:hypothetical protein